MKFSVITPTYNRAYILNQCYESLKNQKYTDFEWIIVNDGSTDNTDEVVQSFIKDGLVDIVYLNQENGGKHRAHNLGVSKAMGELCVCLDSDDALIEDALSIANGLWQEKAGKDIVGILALRGDFQKREPICSLIPEGLECSTMSDLHDKYNFSGDTILFFRTEILKKHYFREFQGEKFLSENNLYIEIDQEGKMLLSNEVLYLCEYLPDGLSARFHKLMRENPRGSVDTYYRKVLYTKSLTVAFKNAIIAQIYNSLIEEDKPAFKKRKLLMLVAKLIEPVFRNRILRSYEGEHNDT